MAIVQKREWNFRWEEVDGCHYLGVGGHFTVAKLQPFKGKRAGRWWLLYVNPSATPSTRSWVKWPVFEHVEGDLEKAKYVTQRMVESWLNIALNIATWSVL